MAEKKLVLLLMLGLVVGLSQALEREVELGKVEDANEETKEQEPVTSVRPLAGAEEDEVTDVDTAGGETKCSRLVCQLKCQMNGCLFAQCLDGGRCRCFCARPVDPFDAFFRSILSSHNQPGLVVRVRPFAFAPRPSDFGPRPSNDSSSSEDTPVGPKSFPGFGITRFGGPHDIFRDFHKLFEEAAKANGGSSVRSRVYQTMQQTCRKPEDCSSACTNCTSTLCVDSLCQCSSCNAKEEAGVESRGGGNVLHTCKSARNCADHCKDCVMTTCRYGVCQCGQCEAETPTTTDAAPTDEATTPTTTATDVTTPTTEVLSVRNNETLSEAENSAAAGAKCVPKKCNHSCWERQCSKWNCVADKCECDNCPDEVSVVVKNLDSAAKDGRPEKIVDATAPNNDREKYEIIF